MMHKRRLDFYLILFLTLFLGSQIQTFAIASELKVGMIQPLVRPGDFQGSLKQFLSEYARLSRSGADLVVGPEGMLPGYPSNDMLFDNDYLDRSEQAVKIVQQASLRLEAAVAVGHVMRSPHATGRAIQNVVSVYQHGELLYRQAKILLPTYGPFDDGRYFEPGKIGDMRTVLINGYKVGFAICEDLWFYDRHQGRLIYHHNPVAKLKNLRPDLVVSLSASPFQRGKQIAREEIVHGDVARRIGVPIFYVNQVAAVDQLIFDGASFVLDRDGKIVMRLGEFKTDSALVTYNRGIRGEGEFNSDRGVYQRVVRADDLDQVEAAVTLGLREFVKAIGHDSVVFGLSGGLDSTMAAYFAAKALGPENVFVIKMPSAVSSEGSITDSDKLTSSLRIPDENVLTLPIKELMDAFGSTVKKIGLDPVLMNELKFGSVALENVQARFRMMIEFFISNLQGNINDETKPIVDKLAQIDPRWSTFFAKTRAKLATSDKSELAVGNGTLFGDIAGVYAPNADLYKTDLWNLGYHINLREGREVIPVAVLAKEPSPELIAKQVTTDIFPDYRIIDPVLKDMIENALTPAQLKAKYGHLDDNVAPKLRPLVDFLVRVYDRSEYKRELMQAPTARVSSRSFGKERRMTIVSKRHALVPAGECPEALMNLAPGQFE